MMRDDPAMLSGGKVAVIADDLTGAMDTGLQFAARNLSTLVALTPDGMMDAQVIAYSTESRELPPSEAVSRLKALLPSLGERLLYKKIDSTLRGNVGYELRALCQRCALRAIVVAPAFPQGGRTVADGILYVDGRPLALTAFRNDPRWPMRESHLPTLLMQQAGMEIGLIPYDVVSRGAAAIEKALRGCPEQIIVADATSEGDLTAIARALHALGPAWVPCGCAGLARTWAAQLVPPPDAAAPVCFAASARPALLVSGSRNPVTIEQVQRLVASGVAHVPLEAQQSYDEDRETARLAGAVRRALQDGQDTLLEASTAPFMPGSGPRISRILARAAGEVVTQGLAGGLFLTGGDIAVAVCQETGVHALRIVHEIQPGLPGGRLVDGPCDGLPAATKAGGFGTPGALLDVRRWLQEVRGAL